MDIGKSERDKLLKQQNIEEPHQPLQEEPTPKTIKIDSTNIKTESKVENNLFRSSETKELRQLILFQNQCWQET